MLTESLHGRSYRHGLGGISPLKVEASPKIKPSPIAKFVLHGLKALTNSHHEIEGSRNRGKFLELLSPLTSVDPDFERQC